jgi:hypothetical protein
LGLSTRIQKLEVVTAPIKAEQQRKRAAREYREFILNELKEYIETSLLASRYVLGDALDEEEAIKDIVEMQLLFHTEATDRFGIDKSDKYKATPEQQCELMREMGMRVDRRFFNIYQTVEEVEKEQEQWRQVRADLEAGVSSAESEAAEYLTAAIQALPEKAGCKAVLRHMGLAHPKI